MRVPTRCDVCERTTVKLLALRQGTTQYTRRKEWPYVYHCTSCGAECGLKTGTPLALGIMADATTRYWRKRAHTTMDKLWKARRGWSRAMVYNNLAAHMNIPPHQCHVGYFNIEQCMSVIEFSLEMSEAATRRKRK
jgi:hypothetical protein